MKFFIDKICCLNFVLIFFFMLDLAGCGGGGSSPSTASTTSATAATATTAATSATPDASYYNYQYAVGGVLSGMRVGDTLVLTNNGVNPLTIIANNAFTFSARIPRNGSYNVAVSQQPAGQICTVSNGSGSGVVTTIINVQVTCSSNSFTVAGSLTGLTSGNKVTLLNNGADPQVLSSNAAFAFNVPVADNSSYAVTVGTQPVGQTCTVSNSTGSGVVANIANVSVKCSAIANTYTIAGAVSGLGAGKQVTLLNNGADPQIITSNSAFTFDVPVATNGSYAVTVGTQPVGQVCTVSNGSGTGVKANVSSVSVACSTDTYTIAGAVTGLSSGQQVTLLNNGANPLTITANSSFTFNVAVAYNGSYGVTVGTQPTGETCTVSNGSGSGVVANVSTVSVSCSATTHTVAGTVTGLASGQQVTLLNNGANSQVVTSNSAFTFSVPIANTGSYAVTVGTQPVGQVCTVSNGSGSNVVANVVNVGVTCSTDTYKIAGTVTGLGSGLQVTLLNNGANAQTVTSNSTFTFSVPVAYGGSYAVTVSTQPTGQTCTVASGSGAGVVANVSNVGVSCVASATTPPPSTSLVFSPYMYAGDYNYVSNALTTDVTGTIESALTAMPAKLPALTWAFATGTCGSETWSGISASAFASANVASFVNAGKKYIVSTGGAGNNFLCSSNADFLTFINTYYSANMIGVDFDIENTQTQTDVNNLVQVIVAAQSTYPNLHYSFTVGSNGGSTQQALGSFGKWVMAAIKTYGLKNYTINLMTMDYTSSGTENATLCTLMSGQNLCEMGQSAVTAAQDLHNYYGVPYNQIEVTPMIGGNDNHDEIFTIADAGIVSSFALANNLGGIHFWAFSRDKDCAATANDGTSSDTCNNYGKAGTLGYTNAFISDLGL